VCPFRRTGARPGFGRMLPVLRFPLRLWFFMGKRSPASKPQSALAGSSYLRLVFREPARSRFRPFWLFKNVFRFIIGACPPFPAGLGDRASPFPATSIDFLVCFGTLRNFFYFPLDFLSHQTGLHSQWKLNTPTPWRFFLNRPIEASTFSGVSNAYLVRSFVCFRICVYWLDFPPLLAGP